MFSKSKDRNTIVNTMNKNKIAHNSAPSIIGSDVTIEGNLTTRGEIQLDGCVKGDVKSASLTVGEGGSVKGAVTAETIVIKGTVTGQIKGRNIRLEKTARVEGDVCHETLSVEAGAFIEGALVHQDNPLQDNVPKPVQTLPTDQKSA